MRQLIRFDNLVFFIDEEHRQAMLRTSLEKLEAVKRSIDSSNDGDAIRERYGQVSLKFNELNENKSFFYDLLDRNSVDSIEGIDIIGKILKSLQEEYSQCKSIEDLMQKVVKPFLKEESVLPEKNNAC